MAVNMKVPLQDTEIASKFRIESEPDLHPLLYGCGNMHGVEQRQN